MNESMIEKPPDAELTRLADGSLSDEQADDVRVRVRGSPELQARMREQQRAVLLIQATQGIVAPSSLHVAVREQIASRPKRAPRISARPAWRPRVFAPLAAGALAAVVLIVVFLSHGSQLLTVTRTARLALARPTRSAPAVDPSDSDLLSLRVGPIAFPAYERRVQWRATGARSDRIDGRRAQTVFYEVAGQQVGYTIVAGRTLHVPQGHPHTIGSVRYVTAGSGSAGLVTWRRDGHTCVIAGRGVSERTLLRLAAASQIST
jgi:hypothetical protein